ncbi:hypothetical protein CRG98_025138 [Punica granatum]|nr:hypothetical protein CRG98_025138 [Punica granatum]
MQKQKSQYHWDKRSKKYVKLNNGDRVTASGKIKTESGSKVKAKKTGIYNKWKQRSHSKISHKETSNEETGGEYTSVTANHGSRWGKKKLPNAHVRPEIKDLEQVRKERQKKADRMSYVKSKAKRKQQSTRNGRKGKGKSKK